MSPRFAPLVLAGLLALAASDAVADPVVWVSDGAGRLGRVDVANGATTFVGNTGTTLTDLAFAPDGATLYGLSFTQLFRVNTTTAALTLVGNTGLTSGNALVFNPDGTLYAAASNTTQLYTVSTATGATTAIGGTGVQSAGDLAFSGGQLYLSADNGNLVRLALAAGTVTGATAVGPLGSTTYYGLASPNLSTLYGITGSTVSAVDPLTGATSALSTYGAALGPAFGSAFPTEAVVPEPGAALAVGAGVGTLALRRRR